MTVQTYLDQSQSDLKVSSEHGEIKQNHKELDVY